MTLNAEKCVAASSTFLAIVTSSLKSYLHALLEFIIGSSLLFFGSIQFVSRNFGFIFIYNCSLTLLVFKIVLRTFLLSFDWLVVTGEQFSRPCRCLNITKKPVASACLQQECRVRSTILKFLCHICVIVDFS